jgi:hypothetical protein
MKQWKEARIWKDTCEGRTGVKEAVCEGRTDHEKEGRKEVTWKWKEGEGGGGRRG